VSLLYALPLVPLVVALWMALSPRPGQQGRGWVVALVAAFPLLVAALAAPERLEVPGLLVTGNVALLLDGSGRAALLLFGGLWLTAGLLLATGREPGPSALTLLVALSGATALAIAEGGPLVYAGMLVTGYGLYAIMAGTPGDGWRRAGRTLIVLLVISDLLVFEILLSVTAKPGAGLTTGLLLLGLVALVLRGAIPPAHAWLPPALLSVGTPAAVLLVAVPPAMALFGGLKILGDGARDLGLLCQWLGVAGAAWAALAGIAQTRGRATLAYAVAATAALLLMALPAGVGAGQRLAWLGLGLLAASAVLPLVSLHCRGWLRDLAIAAALLIHGLSAGEVAWHATAASPPWNGALAPLAAVLASLLLTLAIRRTPPAPRNDVSIETTWLAFTPVILAAIGLMVAWRVQLPQLAAAWIAPVGVTLGLLLHRLLPARAGPAIPPGDLLGPVERFVAVPLRWLRVICLRYLPRLRDRLEISARRLWDGKAWSRRVHRLDLHLRAWPATSVMMLLFALGAAFLLAR
jgi:hypothetical protein